MSVDDHGLETLKKAAEEITPGDLSEYQYRVRVTESALPDGAATEATLAAFQAEAHQDSLDAQDAVDELKAVVQSESDATQALLQSEFDATQALIQTEFDETQIKQDATNTKLDAANASLDDIESNLETNINVQLSTRATEATLLETNLRIGDETESAAGTDTSTSGLNGLVKRLLQRTTTLITTLVDGTQIARAYGRYNATIPTIVDQAFDYLQLGRSGGLISTIQDDESTERVSIDRFRTLKIGEWTRLLGGNPDGNTINTRIWTSAVTGSGTVTSGSGLFTLTTGATSNSTATLTSVDVAPYNAGAVNCYLAGVRLGDTGTTNNERRWGAWTSTDGLFFKLAGSTFSVVRMQASSETVVTSASFNGQAPTIDTNFHTYEICYSSGTAMFFQDRKLLHVLTTTTTALADTMHLSARSDNRSVSGGTTSAQLFLRGQSINRVGRPVGRPRATVITAAGTTTLKSGPGTLHSFVLTRSGGLGGTTFQIYDNTAASGTLIYQVTLSANGVIPVQCDVDYNTGLTVVVPGSSEASIVWE